MDVLESLENRPLPPGGLKTMLKSAASDSSNFLETQQLNGTNEKHVDHPTDSEDGEEHIENEMNDDYETHQSKIIAQQFEINDDDRTQTEISFNISAPKPVGNDQSKTVFTSAIQRVKLRMQKLKDGSQYSEGNGNSIVETQPLESSSSLAETQDLHLAGSENKLPDNSTEKYNEMGVASSVSTVVMEKDTHAEDISVEATKNHMERSDADDDDVDDDDDDDDDDDIIKPTQRRKTILKGVDFDNANDRNNGLDLDISQNQDNNSTSQLASLFVEENEGENTDEDDLRSRIDNYDHLTAEQRYLARKEERAKLRAQQRQSMDKEIGKTDVFLNGKTVVKKTKNRKQIIEDLKLNRIKKEELIRQNHLLKKSMEKVSIIKPTKFSKDELFNKLNFDSGDESQEENENGINNPGQKLPKNSANEFQSSFDLHNSPQTSFQEKKNNKKSVIPTLIKRCTIKTHEKLIDLDSESDSENMNDYYSGDYNDGGDDGDDPDASITRRTKILDIKLFYSKKKKQKFDKIQKRTLTEKIRKLNAKQLKGKISTDNSKEVDESKNLTDEVLAKMLLEDQLQNSKSREKKMKEERKRQKQKDLLRSGKLTHDDDDPEFSEYSSDYDISSDDDPQNDDEKDELETDPQTDNFKLTNTDNFEEFNFSLENMFDKSITQKAQDYLTSVDKFKILKGKQNNSNNGDLDDDTNLQTQETEETTLDNFGNFQEQTSFLTNQLRNNSTDISITEHTSVQLKDMLDSQNLILETQADSLNVSTQQLQNSQDKNSDQIISKIYAVEESTQLTQHDSNRDATGLDTKMREGANGDHNDDDFDDDDEKIKVGRHTRLEENSDVGEEDNDETEEVRQRRAEMIKEAKRKERELMKKREREFKAKGLGDIMEHEAVESDDEYQGVGGVDKDLSDEENSEDEKLIDDASNANVDENEMRRFQLDKELEEDRERVAKTYKDVKTHKLGERKSKDGVYGLGLSDDEYDEQDELLKYREYIRKRQLKERREIMERNKVNITDDDPKKPFFDAMAVNIPSHISIYKDSFTNSLSELNSDENNDNTSNNNKTEFNAGYNNSNTNSEIKRPGLKKRKFQSFDNDDDIRFSSFQDQEHERLKGDVLSDETDDDDHDGSKQLKILKKRTSVKLSRKLRASKNNRENTGDSVHDDIESATLSSFSLLSKSNSITNSFKKATEKKVKISANTGNVIRDVHVTTNSKTVTNSKAAVTRLASSESVKMGGLDQRIVKGSGADRLDRMLAKSRKRGIKKIGQRY